MKLLVLFIKKTKTKTKGTLFLGKRLQNDS